MKRMKLLSAAVALMLAIGLIVSCENNPVAPENNTATQPTLQLANDVQPQALTAEALGLAKSVGLHSSYGRISKRHGGWLIAPGVLLKLPPDNDWKDREHYYFKITLADNAEELEEDHGGPGGGKDSGQHFGEIKQDVLFAFKITLYDHKGEQVHINLDYSAWPDVADLNDFYKRDERDTKDGTATLYIHKGWLNYLNIGLDELATRDLVMAHYDIDSETFDGNEVRINQEYQQWLTYDLPGFSKWAWVW